MEIIAILLAVAYLLSPIPLLILLLVRSAKANRLEALLNRLYAQGRVSPQEMREAGAAIRVPGPQGAASVQSAVPVQQTLPAPQPVLTPPSAVPSADVQTLPVLGAPAAENRIQDSAAPAAHSFDLAKMLSDRAELEKMQALLTDGAISQQEFDDFAQKLPAQNKTERRLTPGSPEAEISILRDRLREKQISEEDYQSLVQVQRLRAAENYRAKRAAAASADPVAASVPVQPAAALREQRPIFRISAITAMLSVGVVLIVLAGMLFVRSAWSNMSAFGRLGALAAGSVLFFGASALARKLWKLNRTGMAFFTLGAFFLPISIWAAGYFRLLGEGLSGAGNPWLITLAFASFTLIAFQAVRIYRQTGWGAAVLCGGTATFLYLVAACFRNEPEKAVFPAAALLALALTWTVRPLIPRLPEPVANAAKPFAVCYTVLLTAAMFLLPTLIMNMPTGAAAMICAAAYLAPMMTERLRAGTAFPVTLLLLLGYGMMLHPLYSPSGDAMRLNLGSYSALFLIAAACTLLILRLTGSLPEQTDRGFFAGTGFCLAGSVLVQLIFAASLQIPVLAAAAILLLLLLIPAIRQGGALLTAFAAVQAWILTIDIASCADLTVPDTLLLAAMLNAFCFAGFFAVPKLRGFWPELIFSVSASAAALCALGNKGLAAWQITVGILFAAAAAFVYWRLATVRDTQTAGEHVFAVLMPVPLFFLTVCLADLTIPRSKYGADWIVLGWMLVSASCALLAYLTTKKRFHSVRRLLFALLAIPPLVLAAMPGLCFMTPLRYAGQAFCAFFALLLWRLFASRGFRGLAVGSFASAVGLILLSTGGLWKKLVFSSGSDYPVYLLTAIWVAVLAFAAILISKRMLLFVGNDAVYRVMQVLTPVTALYLSFALIDLSAAEWQTFYFIFAFGMCVLAWMVTKSEQWLLPGFSVLAVLVCLEALRVRIGASGYGVFVTMVLCFAGLEILLPYLGTVAREGFEKPAECRRSYVLTAAGGVIPFWVLAAANGLNSVFYSHKQEKILLFFVPVLIAGYLLHFAFTAKERQHRSAFMTAAGAFCVIAFWMQPFVHVTGTYWDGKLHLIPLIAFGLLIRYLYGEKTGSGFLFAIGIYTMLRLAGSAIARETTGDLLTVFISALVIFIASFYVKQKKWFLLGGVSLCGIAVYMRMRLFPGMQWWVYLLLAGILLIVIAAVNETMKQRGDSLKSKAGRLWEDWSW